MPVYEYRCDTRNIQFELRQKFSDPPADKCPKCSGGVRKLVSAASFSLKGAGWYGDGYGDKAEPAKSEGEPAAVGSGDGTADAGTKSEGAPTDSAPAETSVLPAAQSTAITQVETKSKVAETPTTSSNKSVVKTQTD